MGAFAIKPIIQFFAWLVASVLVYLNVKMVTGEASNFFATSDNTIGKISIVLSGLLFAALLIYSIIFPLLGKRKNPFPYKCIPIYRD